jgi:hypothetical protein
LQLDQASLGLSREYLTKGFSEKLVDAYYKYVVDIAVILGANRERATKEIAESIEFEMKLANVSACMPLCLCPAQMQKQGRNAVLAFSKGSPFIMSPWKWKRIGVL